MSTQSTCCSHPTVSGDLTTICTAKSFHLYIDAASNRIKRINILMLTLSRPILFSIKIHTIKSGLSLVFSDESHVIISINIVVLSVKINYV